MAKMRSASVSDRVNGLTQDQIGINEFLANLSKEQLDQFADKVLVTFGGKKPAKRPAPRPAFDLSEHKPETTYYKGNPLLDFGRFSGKPFSFGVLKAIVLLEYVDDIREFVEKHRK